MTPKFFKKPADFRKWLEKNHERETELYVGFYKTGTGKPSITWSESVDQALCFGWIDGIRKSIDEESYMIRFTPRKPGSIWSVVNMKKMEELKAQGLVHPKGIAAYERRKDDKSAIYSFEQHKDNIKLPPEFEAEFKKNKQAWKFFHSSAPSYQRAAIWWVISAKREATRINRLHTLIIDSEAGLRIKELRR
ncbi:MAG TPA: YdeI/OmpD-associated family protein [Flavipsychrobacter sp.]